MSTRDDGQRRLVPRWRYSRHTILGCEHQGDPRAERRRIPSASNLKVLQEHWERTRSPLAALELVTAAVIDAHPEVARSAAEQLLASPQSFSTEVLGCARFVLGERAMPDPGTALVGGPALEQPVRDARQIITHGRKLLRDYPRNVARRLDVARAFAVLGEADAALREMRIAAALAPDHRVVLRTAARLLAHLGRADEAHAILSAHPRTRKDPWLMATEISLAMILERMPQSPRAGRVLIGDSGLPPGHLSELASALATFDAQNGDTKRARKLYALSLEQPNDNVLAQAHWLAERDSSLRGRLARTPIQLPGCMEAECFRAQAESRWRDALEHAYEWHYDEPYSSRPATTASFIAAVALQDYAASIQIARAGLKADPKDDLLTNNLIYALARKGEIKEAAARFDTLAASAHPRVSEFVFVATRGLLAFGRGDEAAGRADYKRAFDLAESVPAKVLVLASWGQTEALYHTKVADAVHESLQCVKHLRLDAVTRCAVGAFERIYQAERAAQLAPREAPVPTLHLPPLPQEVK